MRHRKAGGAFALGLALSIALALHAVPAAGASTYADAVLADAPRGYWRLGDSASPAVDASGLGSAGTFVGGVALGLAGALPGEADTAARLDGVNDLVTMGDPASGALDFGTGDFSIELWVRTAFNGERSLAAKRGTGAGSWLLTVTDDTGHAGHIRAGVSDGVTGQQVYSTRAIDDGAWHHVVVVVDRDAALRYYVDGVAAGTAPGPPPGSVSNSGPFQLGKVSGYGHLNGELDEVAVYATALTPEQISAHYGAAAPDLPATVTIVTGPADPTGATDATFSFFASEPASLECSLDGGPYVACVSPNGYAGLAEGLHVARVRAIDLGGQTGPATTYAWRVDLTPPPAPVVTHAPPALSNDPDDTISFSSESGASFLCRLDTAGDFAGCASPFPYAGLADGPHHFEVKALDAAGNAGPAAAVAWQLDTIPPTPPLLTGSPTDPSASGDAELTFTRSDGVGFLCRFNGSAFAPCTSPQTYTGLPDDRHVFDVRTVDEAGNGSEPVRFTWTIERGPPEPTIDSGPLSLTAGSGAQFAFSDAAAEVTYHCRLDAGAFEPCASPHAYVGLTDGTHAFEVKAFFAGGWDSPADTYDWSIDTAGPGAPALTSRPAETTASSAATIAFSDGSEPTTVLGGALPAPLPEATGPTYYVSTTGSDANPGSEALPWRTVQRALDRLRPGERALVREGLYEQNLRVNHAGTAAAPFAIEAYPGEQPVLRPSQVSPSFPIRITSDGAYFRVRGFVIENAKGSTTAGVYVSNPAHHIELSNNEIRGSESHGILLDGDTAFVHILGNHIHHNGHFFGEQDHGIYFQGSDQVAADNVIHDQPFGFGIQVFDENHRSLVVNNTIVRNGKSGVVLGGSVGVDGVRVIGNILAFNARYGIGHDAFHPTASRADHNVIFGNGDGAFDPAGTGIDFSGGNVLADPRLASLSQGDLRLLADSPALGAADPAYTRPVGGRLLGGPPDSGALESVVRFECSLDGGAYEACASPSELTGLGEGEHRFRVRALDDAGNPSAPAEVEWSVDTVAPVAFVSQAPPDPSNDEAPTVGFDASETGSTFECKLDAVGFSACTSPVVYSALEDGLHEFAVRATDRAGNTGPATRYAWEIDTQAPAPPAIGSGPPALTNSRSAELAFSSVEPGASFDCDLNGLTAVDCRSPIGYEALADGAHAFEVVARDAAGNASAPAVHAWTVDATPPVSPAISSGPAALTRSAEATIAFGGSEPGLSFSCRFDASALAACTSPQLASGLSDGVHRFEVLARDAAGNSSETAVIEWVVDTTPPDAPAVTTGPVGLTRSRDAELAFSSGDPQASLRCSLDGSPSADCASPLAYAGLADGPHAFRVVARDPAGNESAPAFHAWTVDATPPPQPAITSAPESVTTSTSSSFAFTHGEAGVHLLCRLDGASFAECTSPAEYSGLAAGMHTFALRARDAAGNESPAATHVWTIGGRPSYDSVIAADGPAGYWRLGEAAGVAVAADSSGGGNSGAYAGGVALGVAGALVATDTAAHFDGVNDLAAMGDPVSGVLDFGTADFSVELWLRTTVHGERTLVGKRTSSGPSWLLTVTDDPGQAGRVRAVVTAGGVTRQVYSAGRVDDGAWHHLVVVVDRDTGIGFHVDGAASGFAAGATTVGTVSNTAPFQVGKASGYGYFSGDLDEVAVYPSALPADRIRAHFDAARG